MSIAYIRETAGFVQTSTVKSIDMIGKGNYEYALPFYNKRMPILIDLAREFHMKGATKYKSISWRQSNVLVGESLAPHLPGGKTIIWGNASVFRDTTGEVIAAIETIRDITEQRAVEAQIHHLAYFDTLTGLPNRTLLMERANETIDDARNNNEPLTLMFLDLDQFKNVNDTLGHRVGDKLLVHVAQRLESLSRKQDTVFRLGGMSSLSCRRTLTAKMRHSLLKMCYTNIQNHLILRDTN